MASATENDGLPRWCWQCLKTKPLTCTVEEMAQVQKMIAYSVAFHYILKTPMHFEHAVLACG